MGYKHGTQEFQDCYRITLEHHAAGAATAGALAPYFVQRSQPAPMQTCQTRFVAGAWQTTCF